MIERITEEEKDRYVELQEIALDAARHGRQEVLIPMLDAGMPVSLADEKGNSLVMLAAYNGQEEMTRVLLQYGADPDQRNARGQTALAGVAFKGNYSLVELLVREGADPLADQGGGKTAVMFAAMFGHPKIVAFLENVIEDRSQQRVLGVRASVLAFLVASVRGVFCKRRKVSS